MLDPLAEHYGLDEESFSLRTQVGAWGFEGTVTYVVSIGSGSLAHMCPTAHPLTQVKPYTHPTLHTQLPCMIASYIPRNYCCCPICHLKYVSSLVAK